jgi:16S rRNA (cytosine1402-N4)-methyltransferase
MPIFQIDPLEFNPEKKYHYFIFALMFHIPILLEEFLSYFQGKKIRYFVDGTLGAGGHAEAILQAHPEIEKFYGIDRDPEALEIAKTRLKPFKEKIFLCHGSYEEIDQFVPQPIDGAFLDLGVSSMQLDRPEKGFSLYKEGPLDMRMDPHADLDAARIVNTFSEQQLGRIFREYGEEPRWKRAAKSIVEARKKHKIKTTVQLSEILSHALSWKGRKSKKIHPATLIFQALRIAVNRELEGLQIGLPKILSLLAPQGRLGVISFHSLEDRIVKTVFKEESFEKRISILTKKPVVASREEIKKNTRSRSAKLRFAEKLTYPPSLFKNSHEWQNSK